MPCKSPLFLVLLELQLVTTGIFAVKDSTEPCAGQVQVDSPGTGKLPCLSRCPTNITNSHEWEIQYPQECVCNGMLSCKGFCKRVLFLSNGSFQLHDYDNNCSDRVLSTGDTNANYSRCWPLVKQMNIDHMSGSLKGPIAMWNGLKDKGAFAKCSVQGCLNDQQPVEVQDDQLFSPSQLESDIHYTKCSPELTTTTEAVIYPEPVHLLYGSSNQICLSVTLTNNPPVGVAFNGEDANKTELHLGGEGCEACSTECYEKISNELGREALHTEVVVAYLRKTCLKKISDVNIYIPFIGVNSSDSGNWTIKLPTQSVVYNTSVELRTTREFFYKPPQTRKVMMGSNVAIPCVLLAPINQSDDSIYWKAPSGEIEVNSTNVSTNLSADLACQVFGREGSHVFAMRESQVHYSPGGTLRRHSLVLYVCDATMREKGAYSCGVQDNGTTFLATTLLSVQESIAGVDDYLVTTAVLVPILTMGLLLLVILFIQIRVYWHRIATHRKPSTSPADDVGTLLGPNFNSLPGFLFAQLLASGTEQEENHWEFPRENLHSMEVIGEGNFGRVMKARAEGIIPDFPEVNVVAVKVVKGDPPRPCDVDDLWAELQLMKSIKPHPNIVNILGHCTKPDGPLCIIMEFATYGSLKSFLRECQEVLQQTLTQSSSVDVDHSSPAQSYLAGFVSGANHHQDSEGPDRMQRRSESLEDPFSLYGDTNRDDFPRITSNCAHYRPPAASSGSYALSSGSYVGGEKNKNRNGSLSSGSYVGGEKNKNRNGSLSSGSYVGGEKNKNRNGSLSSGSYVGGEKNKNRNGSLSSGSYVGGEKNKNRNGSLSSGSYVGGEKNRNRNGSLSSGSYVGGEKNRNRNGSLSSGSYVGGEKNRNRNGSLSSGSYIRGLKPPQSRLSSQLSSGYGSWRTPSSCVSDVDSSPYYPTYPSLLKDVDVFNIGLQVARGMEHLEKLKCVHRDLAARNVLIADNFLIKICDFGLARETGDSDYYRSKTPRPLPARWMAVETLTTGIHTPKSDVWSYGVLLWEVLTYGKVPYHDSAVAIGLQSLKSFLLGGGRLKKPPGCSDPMYYLLQKCWERSPSNRPSFSELVDVFDKAISLCENYYQFSGCKPRSGSLASIHSGNIEQVTVSSNLCAGETTPCSPVTTPCSPVTTPSLRSDKEFVNGNAPERACTKGKHPRTKQVFYPARKYQTVSTGVECSDV